MSYNKDKLKYDKHEPVTYMIGEDIEYKRYPNAGKYGFKGTGLVLKISRGTNFDVILVRFGVMTARTREIIVIHSRARRQILTLKRGQFADFLGEAVVISEDRPDNPYKNKFVKRLHFTAFAIRGWYTPKAFDVKKYEEDIANGEEENYIDPLEEDKEKQIEKTINDLFDKKGDDDE